MCLVPSGPLPNPHKSSNYRLSAGFFIYFLSISIPFLTIVDHEPLPEPQPTIATMKVTATIRKDRTDKEGLSPVLLRINQGEKRMYETTDIKVSPRQWKKGVVINHPHAKHLNNQLRDLIEQAELRYENGVSRLSFEGYADKFIRLKSDTKKASAATLTYYRTELKKFLEFAPNVSLNDIKPDLLHRYHAHLTGKGNGNNTVWKAFKFIKSIISDALYNDALSKNPLQKFKGVKYEQTERAWLTAEEVNKIEQTIFSPELQEVANSFLVQCYTGLRISDFRNLNIAKVLAEKKFIIRMVKTEQLVTIPLSANTKTLLKKLKPLEVSDQQYNRLLKDVAFHAGINKKLTSHVGRHTAAMRMAEIGISKEVAQVILGHRKASTTDIYYRIQNERLNKEFKKFGY